MKRTRQEYETFFPKDGDHFDVIVGGGGPAGIGAALAAATNGAKTLLLEGRAFFGGVAAVSGWMPMNRILRNGQSRGGVNEIFVNKLRSYGSHGCRDGKVTWVDADGLHVHPEYLRLGVMELLEEHDCKYLVHSPITGVEMDGRTITSVVCAGKYGRRTYSASVYIDTTGDGDIAYHAGVPMLKGREEDGAFMPTTIGLVLANVDEEKLFSSLNERPQEPTSAMRARIDEKAAKEGYTTSNFYSFDRTTIPTVVSSNNGGQDDIGIIDASNIEHLNVALRSGLQVVFDFVEMVRDLKIPGLENCSLVRAGQDLGVRETRRIEGEYTLTLEDCQQGKHFDDVIALRYGTIDAAGLKATEGELHGTIKDGHEYPYRCMLPRRVDPLLVAGRCASLSHLGLSTCKAMGNMMAIGQAAGVAAAICAEEDTLPRDLDVSKVQDRLRSMKVELKAP